MFDRQARDGGLRYAGLGAAIGVPSSKLEAVTSMDPKDYVYCIPSLAQQNAAWEGLHADGTMLDMMHRCPRGDNFAYNSNPFAFYGSSNVILDNDPGLNGILSLDLDAECVKLVMGSASGAGSGSARSDGSTETTTGNTAAAHAAPRMTTRATARNLAARKSSAVGRRDIGDLLEHSELVSIPVGNKSWENHKSHVGKLGHSLCVNNGLMNIADVAASKDAAKGLGSSAGSDSSDDDGELLHAPALVAHAALDTELIANLPSKPSIVMGITPADPSKSANGEGGAEPPSNEERDSKRGRSVAGTVSARGLVSAPTSSSSSRRLSLSLDYYAAAASINAILKDSVRNPVSIELAGKPAHETHDASSGLSANSTDCLHEAAEGVDSDHSVHHDPMTRNGEEKTDAHGSKSPRKRRRSSRAVGLYDE